MSLDKAIEHGKERRKPYRGAKAIDPTCRNHGSCPVCEKNRKHKFRDKHPKEIEEKVNGYYDSIFIDCSLGTGREQMDISKIVSEMSQQISESAPRHLTSRFQIPEYISKERVSAFQEKLKELGAMPSRHPSDAFATLPYTMKITKMMGDDK